MKNHIQNPNQKVVITFDGNQTLARIYENNKVIAKGVATCSPEDEFDIKAGSELALTRALESMKPIPAWVVVKRKPRVGDYIRVTYKGYKFGDYGEVLRVSDVDEYNIVKIKLVDHPKCKTYCEARGGWIRDYWVYLQGEYEVVEPVEDGIEIINGERFRKVDRKPKPGDYMKIIESGFPFEHEGDIYKISEVYDYGKNYNMGVRHGDHPAHMKLFGVNEWYHKDYIWNHWSEQMKFEILEKL